MNEVVSQSSGKISLEKIDIDAHIDKAREHHILSVPTLVLFKEGKEVWRMRGFDTAENLKRIVASHINL